MLFERASLQFFELQKYVFDWILMKYFKFDRIIDLIYPVVLARTNILVHESNLKVSSSLDGKV
jgi:hypothetical protein